MRSGIRFGEDCGDPKADVAVIDHNPEYVPDELDVIARRLK